MEAKNEPRGVCPSCGGNQVDNEETNGAGRIAAPKAAPIICESCHALYGGPTPPKVSDETDRLRDLTKANSSLLTSVIALIARLTSRRH